MTMRCSFNSRSHAGSDDADNKGDEIWIVSIHAPTRGATSARLPLPLQHLEFQFTLPRGERLIPLHFFRDLFAVSIHAPTRGATPWDLCLLPAFVFQFTLPRGERLMEPGAFVIRIEFQFTLPRGERPREAVSVPCSAGFNSRSHAGSDMTEEVLFGKGFVSIHAPTRGATEGEEWQGLHEDVSIHAPTRGATSNGIGEI